MEKLLLHFTGEHDERRLFNCALPIHRHVFLFLGIRRRLSQHTEAGYTRVFMV
jgi:hypothetical protein